MIKQDHFGSILWNFSRSIGQIVFKIWVCKHGISLKFSKEANFNDVHITPKSRTWPWIIYEICCATDQNFDHEPFIRYVVQQIIFFTKWLGQWEATGSTGHCSLQTLCSQSSNCSQRLPSLCAHWCLAVGVCLPI